VDLVDHVVSRVRRVRDRAEDQTTVQECLHRAASWRPLSRSGAAAEDDILGRLSDEQIRSRGEVSDRELAARLEAAVAEALAVIRNTTAERLTERVSIQGYVLTGADLGYYRHLSRASAHPEKTP
jgi:hypothetical protein